jgi:hypothetical protein
MQSFRPHVPVGRKQALPTNLRYLASLKESQPTTTFRNLNRESPIPNKQSPGYRTIYQTHFPDNCAQVIRTNSFTNTGCRRYINHCEWSEAFKPTPVAPKNHIQSNITSCSQIKRKSPQLLINTSPSYGQRTNQRPRIYSSTSTSSTSSDSSLSKKSSTPNASANRKVPSNSFKPIESTTIKATPTLVPVVARVAERQPTRTSYNMMPSVTSRLKKNISRTKEKILQGIGKTDRTSDESFDLYVENFERQHSQANKLNKELNRYLNSLRVC